MSFNGVGALKRSAFNRECSYCGRKRESPGSCLGCGAPPPSLFVPQASPVKKGIDR